MDIQKLILRLSAYALSCGLIDDEDIVWAGNTIALNLDINEIRFTEDDVREESSKIPFEDPENENIEDGSYLENTLSGILDYASENGLLKGDSVVFRDLFDTRLMGALTARPSEVQYMFSSLYQEAASEATDWYYTFSKDTDYIRRYRVKKDLKWKTGTEYGDLDITINLSKPEKDPKAIALAGKMKQSGYPKCQLCRECEGYMGRADYPARENHRIIPIDIQGASWGFQYSPYVYYNEHCIVFNMKHTPMKIDEDCFRKLFDFTEQFPHYFVGSNADLPIVGGSILSHEHFQGGHYEFSMARAEVEKSFRIKGYEDINTGIVKWPMSVIRLNGHDREKIVSLAGHILDRWRNYTDETVSVYAYTDGTPHSTITPIARMKDGGETYELDLVLRNNYTTPDHPLGLFHPHEELHHIKKENIGLIEVMGLAVLPARLKKELEDISGNIVKGIDIRSIESLSKHADWVESFSDRLSGLDKEAVMEILKEETGKVFKKVLEDSGVFKRDTEGREAFERFINSL